MAGRLAEAGDDVLEAIEEAAERAMAETALDGTPAADPSPAPD